MRPLSGGSAGAPAPISIHAPLAGCDNGLVTLRSRTHKFQSTHPLRGAPSFKDLSSLKTEISIHAPLAGCDLGQVERIDARHPAISIHAPLAGCDRSVCSRRAGAAEQFQSTHPLRGATRSCWGCVYKSHHFNPRTPCGVRPLLTKLAIKYSRFQSTHPLRGAT